MKNTWIDVRLRKQPSWSVNRGPPWFRYPHDKSGLNKGLLSIVVPLIRPLQKKKKYNIKPQKLEAWKMIRYLLGLVDWWIFRLQTCLARVNIDMYICIYVYVIWLYDRHAIYFYLGVPSLKLTAPKNRPGPERKLQLPTSIFQGHIWNLGSVCSFEGTRDLPSSN